METLTKDKKDLKKDGEQDYVFVAMACSSIIGVFKDLERGINIVIEGAKKDNCVAKRRAIPDLPDMGIDKKMMTSLFDVATLDLYDNITQELIFPVHFTEWEIE